MKDIPLAFSRTNTIDRIIDAMVELKRALNGALISCPGGTVTNSQVVLLFATERLQPASVKELAQAMHMTPGAISQLFDTLPASWFTRKPGSRDRRTIQVSLSTKGQDTANHIRAGRHAFGVQVCEPFSDAELRTIEHFFATLNATLRHNAHSQVKTTSRKGDS